MAVGNPDCPPPPKDILMSAQEIIDYLMVCYRSLIAGGNESIANGRLRDLIWRLKAFGMTLVKLDIRQESTVHTDCLTAITEYLELGSYKQWSEIQKQDWILKGKMILKITHRNQQQKTIVALSLARRCRKCVRND
jgi:phosphoenolpyruvate carboxylase